MAEHNETGILGEQLAKLALKKKGWTILEENWRTGRLEVDLIALDGDTLVFIEVKTRTRTSFGLPEDGIGAAKEKHLVQAAQKYIQEHKWEGELRFDYVSVLINGREQLLNHIEDAFYPED